MAKATAKCKCVKCGKNFTKEEYKNNRTEADNWKEWAESYYNKCTDCYRNELIETEIKNGNEIIEMHYGDYKNKYSDCKTVQDSYNPETKMIKVIVTLKHRAIKKVVEEFPELKGKEESTSMNYFWDNRKTITPSSEKSAKILEIMNSLD